MKGIHGKKMIWSLNNFIYAHRNLEEKKMENGKEKTFPEEKGAYDWITTEEDFLEV